MTKREKKTGKPTNVGLALHVEPARKAREEQRDKAIAVADEVFDRYVDGESFQAIASSLPFRISGWKLRQILMEADETRETYANANILRSHSLVEASLDYGREAAAIGSESGLKVAIETNLKVAAKLNAAYNDKASLELTGKDGGALEIKADLTLTAEQAYERLIKGK
jgi:hypothetical protein